MSQHPKIIVAAGIYQVHHRHAATVAQEQGFFAEENLNEVEIITTNHNDDNLFIQMVAGNVQFGMDARPQDALRWITQRGAEIYLIGGFKNQVNMDIIGAKGLKSLTDLKGKKIGVSTAKSKDRISLDEYQARIVLKSVKLDPNTDVTWIGGTQMHPVLGDPIGALKRGEVDCIFVIDTNTPKLEAEGFSVLVRFKEFYSGGYPDRTTITTGAMINQYPATVTAFLKSMIRAYRFMRDVPRNFEYVIDLDKRMRAIDNDPKERVTDIHLTAEKMARTPYPIDGRLPIKGLEVILKQEKDAGKVPQSFSLDKLTKTEFVEQANKELDARKDLQEELSRVKKVAAAYGF